MSHINQLFSGIHILVFEYASNINLSEKTKQQNIENVRICKYILFIVHPPHNRIPNNDDQQKTVKKKSNQTLLGAKF